MRPVIESMGIWGQKWVESSLSLRNLDPSLLMWDKRRDRAIAAKMQQWLGLGPFAKQKKRVS